MQQLGGVALTFLGLRGQPSPTMAQSGYLSDGMLAESELLTNRYSGVSRLTAGELPTNRAIYAAETNVGNIERALPEHLAGPDGFTKTGTPSGTHKLDNATAALDAKGATYTVTPTATVGISEISYSRVKPMSGKIITESKTVYDPAVFSDQKMLDYSLKAGGQGWTRYLADPASTRFDVTHGGVNFHAYINYDQYGNPFVGNVHAIK